MKLELPKVQDLQFTTIPYDKNCEHLEDAMSKGGLSLDFCCNIFLPINRDTGNNTTKCHGRSMGDNRNLTGVFHQKVSSLPLIIASDSRSFQSS